MLFFLVYCAGLRLFLYFCHQNIKYMLIGRDNEKRILTAAISDEYSQLIAVYGRRRVGKTFLIRETFEYKFDFQFTGLANTSSRKQLARFRKALKEQGLDSVAQLSNWGDAFDELKRLIVSLHKGKKVIFLDELPWMDAPRSGFLSEFESFWNAWASARKDIVLVVCGSSTSWMVKKIIKNKGGLHNRITHRIALKPFSVGLCEQLCMSRGLSLSRNQIVEAYMIFGGIPYYWSLLQRGSSLTQEIDRLIFADDGELHDEFEMLYASLFKTPTPYIKIVEILAKKKMGLNRNEIMLAGGFVNNGALSEMLDDLEWCGFIRSYSMMGNKKKSKLYQLVDNYTLFYYEFIDGQRHGTNYWMSLIGKPIYNTWCGLAFERVCLWHIDQIKRKLGISGVMTNEYAWRCAHDEQNGRSGVQIDLLVDRADGIIDMCEMKYSADEYVITADYAAELRRKRSKFMEVTKTKKAVHTVMVASNGVAHNSEWNEIQNEVTMDDMFAV